MPQHDPTDDYRYSEAGQRIRATIANAEEHGDHDAVREHEDQLNDLRIENSGVLVTEPCSPGRIVHGEWECIEGDEEDSDGFFTPGWLAQHKVTGETRTIHHSRFSFTMTPARFRWMVEHGFPLPPGKGPWTSAAVDQQMEDGA